MVVVAILIGGLLVSLALNRIVIELYYIEPFTAFIFWIGAVTTLLLFLVVVMKSSTREE